MFGACKDWGGVVCKIIKYKTSIINLLTSLMKNVMIRKKHCNDKTYFILKNSQRRHRLVG